ncbi:hydantoinase/oxoprolinase family protein [Lacipirellula parvula]|uniref:Glutamate synthase n=1 Tax=Lacipirellula parvula TaxID=2650471 RepID=A0A5K7XG36_9BACT|nr:hydantoinase/oxoprolinase family protein [Lacipirellula parvula]BBO33203.1 glutamate synthase [Lacipirellula parvula]
MSWLAIDIGGANLKAADGRGYADSRPFAIWRQPERLALELRELLAAAPAADALAITMTAELADCFETKSEGVRQILAAVQATAGDLPAFVYQVDGRLLPIDAVQRMPALAAASNWHALAAFACRYIDAEPALLLDLGSTTADVIPLTPNGPRALGMSDGERLLAGELIYTGVERTPLCALVRELPWQGHDCPVAAEVFATTADAYLMLGELAEDPHELSTADGRPLTWPHALSRLARMVCADADSFTAEDARLAAATVREAQLNQLQHAVEKVAARLGGPAQRVILSGHGEFLLRHLLDRLHWRCDVLSLTEELGPAVSRCAPAHALAVLARELETHPTCR